MAWKPPLDQPLLAITQARGWRALFDARNTDGTPELIFLAAWIVRSDPEAGLKIEGVISTPELGLELAEDSANFLCYVGPDDNVGEILARLGKREKQPFLEAET